MGRIYDNWERLVAAVMHREELRQLALCDSTTEPSSSSSSSSPSSSSGSRSNCRSYALDIDDLSLDLGGCRRQLPVNYDYSKSNFGPSLWDILPRSHKQMIDVQMWTEGTRFRRLSAVDRVINVLRRMISSFAYDEMKWKESSVTSIDKTRRKAMRVAITFPGVTTVALHGEERNRLVVAGEDIDVVDLTRSLMKIVGIPKSRRWKGRPYNIGAQWDIHPKQLRIVETAPISLITTDKMWAILHTNGCSKGSQGESAARGIIHDMSGNLIISFHEKHQSLINYIAELYAILTGLRLCKEIGFQKVWVEIDSSDVFALISSSYRNLAHAYIINKIREMLEGLEVRISHASREGNRAVDLLANRASPSNTSSLIFYPTVRRL